MAKKGYLILEDGFELEGYSFGYEGENLGEIVFNTSMSGYQEILTDPSYCGQIVTMTYPMIGNYGVNSEDVESSKVQVAGFIVKEYSKNYSNFRADKSLSEYLIENKIPALEGIDSRLVTTHIRDKGALRGGIFFSKEGAVEKLKAFPSMSGLDLASKVSVTEKYDFSKRENGPVIAAIDFGIKTNILRLLEESGFKVKVFPCNVKIEEIGDVSGYFLSNGPGDPEAVECGVSLAKEIIKTGKPCFGICLGHQILSIALGGKTYKLKFGHRGGNQPVKNIKTGRVEITSQNHGFAVDFDSLKDNSDIKITHINLNDNTVEGIEHCSLPLFSVQYHPESNPGPNDSRYLFDEFFKRVGKMAV
ncbi:MAG TPA: glutamine-hydrolyzing carbamoyl-phosphate synthase small subunit [Spirochaetota bacterium]|nr:glutamine-hydrolyzing carbamoyl-phosphate synthase small subunit [Spirochaetota bacterium]